MNRILMGMLIATCALSFWALSTRPGRNEARQVGRVIEPAADREAAGPLVFSDKAARIDIASAWPKPDMDDASRSPFDPPSRPTPKSVVPASAATPPPPPPTFRSNYRFWGRMNSPEKHTFLFLAKGQDGMPVEIQNGTHLDDGWSVESISDNTIVLANAASQRRIAIFVPPADTAPR